MCDLQSGLPDPSPAESANSLTVCATDVERNYFQEAFHTRTTFYVDHKVGLEAQLRHKHRSGQMYVEHLEPLSKTHDVPIVLIHGDFQTGQAFLTKPDGNPGWASFFLRKGYEVYIPDLPYCGRSNYNSSGDSPVKVFSSEVLERELTATAKSDVPGWKRCKLHDKWPGTGMRNDAVFQSFRASLTHMACKKPERESLSQSGLKALLQRSGRAILVGIGAGAVAAWLAADVVPDLVAGVIAIEPSGPPCGFAHKYDEHGLRQYTPFITSCPKIRRYGISDIPLTYFPPLKPKDDEDDSDGFLMDVSFVLRPDGKGRCARQNEIECPRGIIDLEGTTRAKGERNVCKLIHLQKMRHMVVTSHTGHHTNYDWATVNFLRDAGLDVRWMKLEDEGIFGNGHLMYLEENSDRIAARILREMEKMERVLGVDTRDLTRSEKSEQDDRSEGNPTGGSSIGEAAVRVERLRSETLAPATGEFKVTEQPSEPSIDDIMFTTETDVVPSNAEIDIVPSEAGIDSYPSNTETYLFPLNADSELVPSSVETDMASTDHNALSIDVILDKNAVSDAAFHSSSLALGEHFGPMNTFFTPPGGGHLFNAALHGLATTPAFLGWTAGDLLMIPDFGNSVAGLYQLPFLCNEDYGSWGVMLRDY